MFVGVQANFLGERDPPLYRGFAKFATGFASLSAVREQCVTEISTVGASISSWRAPSGGLRGTIGERRGQLVRRWFAVGLLSDSRREQKDEPSDARDPHVRFSLANVGENVGEPALKSKVIDISMLF